MGLRNYLASKANYAVATCCCGHPLGTVYVGKRKKCQKCPRWWILGANGDLVSSDGRGGTVVE